MVAWRSHVGARAFSVSGKALASLLHSGWCRHQDIRPDGSLGNMTTWGLNVGEDEEAPSDLQTQKSHPPSRTSRCHDALSRQFLFMNHCLRS